jgi:hypothetical protein
MQTLNGNLISEVSFTDSYQGMTSVVPLALGMDPGFSRWFLHSHANGGSSRPLNDPIRHD